MRPIAPSNTSVVAVDPGRVTGYARLDGPSGTVVAGEALWQEANEVIHAYIDAYIERTLHVVYERFIINMETTRKSQAPWSLEAIGVGRYLTGLSPTTHFHLQMPVEAKRWSTDARLKAQDWWAPTPDGHANDALRHLYLFLSKRGMVIPPEGVI